MLKHTFNSILFFFRKSSRIVLASMIGFVRDDCYLKASALTFYMLLAIVPMLAVALGIARGFGFQEHLESEIYKAFQDQQDVLRYAVNIAYSLLEHYQGSVIAGVGVILMLWTNLTLLGNIENVLNEIWKVKKSRSWMRKIGDYLATMLLCPLFFVASNSLTVFLKTYLTSSKLIWNIEPLLLKFLNFLPFVFAWLLFSFIYIVLPNTKSHFWPRVTAGVLAGTAFQIWQWIYVKFQVDIFSYSVVYGTFAALPLFLVWLQVSWLIALAGAELAAHIESDMYIGETDSPKDYRAASQKEVALYILYRSIQAFYRGDSPITATQIARELEVSAHDVVAVIDVLEKGNVVGEITVKDSSVVGYQVLRDPKLFTVTDIFGVIENQLLAKISVKDSAVLEKIVDCIEQVKEMSQGSPANLSLHELVADEKRQQVSEV